MRNLSDILISVDIEFKKTLYSISLIVSGRADKKIKDDIDKYNDKLESIINELGIKSQTQRNKKGERKRFLVNKEQSAFEKDELIKNVKNILDALILKK